MLVVRRAHYTQNELEYSDFFMKEFCEIDPYNPQHTVHGCIYNESDGTEKYGCIDIIDINGIACPQWIWATPKFKYPGDSRHFDKFPTEWDHCRIYDKLDGTNILMWNYVGPDGGFYSTYKTRLTPFLRDTGYSTWVTLWGICMKRNPWIHDLERLGINFAFEMYGSLNTILIPYKEELQCKLLYAIDAFGNILDPYNYVEKREYVPTQIAFYQSPAEIGEIYRNLRDSMDAEFLNNKSVEGAMFYFSKAGRCTVIKCKPPSVLNLQCDDNIHPVKIGWNDVYTTALNALEDLDSIDDLLGHTITLLREEYSDTMIEASMGLIRRKIDEIKIMLVRRDAVRKLYKESGLSFKAQKGDVMRMIMQHYPKQLSAEVYHDMQYIALGE